MRVTDRMTFDRAAREGGQARARLDRAVAQASSGVRVVHPGDDPGAASRVAAERVKARRMEAVATATGRASDELAAVDAALGEVANGLARAQELAAKFASAPYDAAQRATGAREVRGLLASAVASLGVKVGNRYLLGGFRDGAPPFDASGAYLGDAGVREVELAPGVRQPAGVRADVAIAGAGGGVDVLATLAALASALDADDPEAIRATLSPLARGTDQLSSARGAAGAAMAALDAATRAGQAARDDARAAIGKLADADPIAAASELALAQRALDAALTATAKGFQLTLLDRLR
ncbi:flagellar biosynthesis protein FlgL [Anaeromyxobacter sp. PSR-1]|uniref:flagellin N-terminal helical domain-containing protein n=1 Tax=unclassified Anaeromyxobacter TaxID=2620896 RepID=UPI0005EA3033|nr:flagellar biosynthesis protein FlgL [Anaeromyxobacter sp. PSR-1]GAO04639.1 flagellar hook-associated protein 3 [Anaeromyxobacter sp. PSR-1]